MTAFFFFKDQSELGQAMQALYADKGRYVTISHDMIYRTERQSWSLT